MASSYRQTQNNDFYNSAFERHCSYLFELLIFFQFIGITPAAITVSLPELLPLKMQFLSQNVEHEKYHIILFVNL